MKIAVITLAGLLTEWHETCALGEPSLFPEEWLMGFQSPSAQWAQEDWPGRQRWSGQSFQQQLLGQWRGLGCACCPGHVSHSKPPPSQSIQQLQCFQWAFISAGQAFVGWHIVPAQGDRAGSCHAPSCPGSPAKSQYSKQSLQWWWFSGRKSHSLGIVCCCHWLIYPCTPAMRGWLL